MKIKVNNHNKNSKINYSNMHLNKQFNLNNNYNKIIMNFNIYK